ncbi:hypothetical protein H9L15_15755 (plasmid) [Sphingomonas daechungensis]|uniref:Uncharacterized protein n=1 Tax=Sphingomonas daechungensis TaxID=1176646 RepID=A0ABX6T6A9_9SPHN|nr:hypothetical protein [Sphingomonas daechungensis]QNP44550.1 hypothetical protein H9L15_15755 [Sphingomonas daechungensis]
MKIAFTTLPNRKDSRPLRRAPKRQWRLGEAIEEGTSGSGPNAATGINCVKQVLESTRAGQGKGLTHGTGQAFSIGQIGARDVGKITRIEALRRSQTLVAHQC